MLCKSCIDPPTVHVLPSPNAPFALEEQVPGYVRHDERRMHRVGLMNPSPMRLSMTAGWPDDGLQTLVDAFAVESEASACNAGQHSSRCRGFRWSALCAEAGSSELCPRAADPGAHPERLCWLCHGRSAGFGSALCCMSSHQLIAQR